MAVLIARDAALGFEVRDGGVAADPRRLTAYTSTAVHSCVPRPWTSPAWAAMRCGSSPLTTAIASIWRRSSRRFERDREAGFTPFFVVGTAGTVDTGAIDDLAGMAELCQREKLWFHVDGAFGALAKLAPDLAPQLNGIERADSWPSIFTNGDRRPTMPASFWCATREAHKQAFALPAAYLQRAERGLAAGSPWPCDFGPDLSRGFRALKVWFTLKVLGTERLGASISRSCALARYLEGRISRDAGAGTDGAGGAEYRLLPLSRRRLKDEEC